MWVRSQDKEILINANVLSINKHVCERAYYIDAFIVPNNAEKDYFVVGKYDTEGAALAELDYIHQLINDNLKSEMPRIIEIR